MPLFWKVLTFLWTAVNTEFGPAVAGIARPPPLPATCHYRLITWRTGVFNCSNYLPFPDGGPVAHGNRTYRVVYLRTFWAGVVEQHYRHDRLPFAYGFATRQPT